MGQLSQNQGLTLTGSTATYIPFKTTITTTAADVAWAGTGTWEADWVQGATTFKYVGTFADEVEAPPTEPLFEVDVSNAVQ